MQLTEFLEDRGIDFRRGGEHHHVSGDFVGTDCFLCSPNSKKFKLGFRQGWKGAVCWECGPMSAVKALAEITGENPSVIYSMLDGLDLKPALPERRVRGKLVVPEGTGSLLAAHRRYLKGRGLDPDKTAQLWGIRGIGIAPKWPWSIWIPVHHKGEIISWTTRSISDERPNGRRYGNAKRDQEILPAKSVLFGLDYVRHAAIVVEGAFDVFKIGPGAVATMGLVITPEQKALLSTIALRVVCFDREANAQIRAKALCSDLASFPGRTIRVELSSKDAGSADDKEIRQLRQEFLE